MTTSVKHLRLFQVWAELHAKWKANGLAFADMLELDIDRTGNVRTEVFQIVIVGPTARVPRAGFEDRGGAHTAQRLLSMAVAALVVNEAGPR